MYIFIRACKSFPILKRDSVDDWAFSPLKLVSTHLYIYYEAEENQKLTQLLLKLRVFSLSYSKSARTDLGIRARKNSSTHFK